MAWPRILLVASLLLPGCDGARIEVEGTLPPLGQTGPRSSETASAQSGEHGPFEPQAAVDPTTLDGHALPLVAGSRDAKELLRVREALPPDLRKPFEEAFRRAYTADRQKKNFTAAQQGFVTILKEKPDFAPAHKGLAYVLFSMGRTDLALRAYEKALELDPEYGEAHYALAFLLVMVDKNRGKPHFDRAMELGIDDDRRLRERFYGQ